VKRIDVSKATAPLSKYATRAGRETVVVTVRGKPVIAVVSLEGVDAESLAVSTSPKFLGIIERSRKRHADEGGISAKDVRRLLGLEKKKRAKSKASPKNSPRTQLTRKGRASRGTR
jgi:hypothetical protein